MLILKKNLLAFLLLISFSTFSQEDNIKSNITKPNKIGLVWSFDKFIGAYYNRDFKRSFAEISYIREIGNGKNSYSIWGEYGYFIKKKTTGSFITMGVEFENYTFEQYSNNNPARRMLFLYSKYGYRLLIKDRFCIQPTVGMGYGFEVDSIEPSEDKSTTRFDLEFSVKMGFSF